MAGVYRAWTGLVRTLKVAWNWWLWPISLTLAPADRRGDRDGASKPSMMRRLSVSTCDYLGVLFGHPGCGEEQRRQRRRDKVTPAQEQQLAAVRRPHRVAGVARVSNECDLGSSVGRNENDSRVPTFGAKAFCDLYSPPWRAGFPTGSPARRAFPIQITAGNSGG